MAGKPRNPVAAQTPPVSPGKLGWKKYLQALPFCVSMLIVPLLPTAGILYVRLESKVPIVGVMVLLLTFGFPILRHRRPRAAWWVGTLVAAASLPGLVITMVIAGRFFGFLVLLSWILAAAFVVLNWRRFRPWTFLIFVAIIFRYLVPLWINTSSLSPMYALFAAGLIWLAAHYLWLEKRQVFPYPLLGLPVLAVAVLVGDYDQAPFLILGFLAVAVWAVYRYSRREYRDSMPWPLIVSAPAIVILLFFDGSMLWMILKVMASLLALGLPALYFRLPDRDRFPRAPIVVTMIMSLLLSSGLLFYFDVGGSAEVQDHPATQKVFEYTNQRRGWSRTIGLNPRFLAPSCDGRYFYVGTKFTWQSALISIDPTATGVKKIRGRFQLKGGSTDNAELACRDDQVDVLYVGDMGRHEVLALNAANSRRFDILAQEKLGNARVGLLRLDKRARRPLLFVASANQTQLQVLDPRTLAPLDLVDFQTSITDIALDHQPQSRGLVVATMGGEITRLTPHAGQAIEKTATAHVNIGRLFFNLALDPRDRRVFVSSMFGRHLAVLDADTLAEIGTFRVKRGSRYMQFDRRRGLLYVGNFFHGAITAYRFAGGELEKVWSLNVGRRVRYLTLDERSDRLCLTSKLGGYCLRLEALSPAPTATEEPGAPGEPTSAEEHPPEAEEETPAVAPDEAGLEAPTTAETAAETP